MNSPNTRFRRSQRRRRNFIAKKLREDKQFAPRVEDKKHKDEPKHRKQYLDELAMGDESDQV